ncbi:MAG: hypothetical protein ACOH2R_03915 [Pseudomonas sp.]
MITTALTLVGSATSVMTKSSTAPVKESGSLPASISASETAKVSALSRQLSESATRADARDGSASRSELGEFAERILNRLVGDVYQANKAKHNREVPDTDDPALLKRARQATEFLTQKFSGDFSGKNPFSGLSREQLSTIVYDEAGPYTVNERRAAWGGVQDLEQQWRGKLMADGWAESATTGKKPKFYAEVLAHYKSLPLIEQAQYPGDYEARIQSYIDGAQEPEGKPEDDFLTLVDIVAKTRKPDKKAEESEDTNPASGSMKSQLKPAEAPAPPVTSAS